MSVEFSDTEWVSYDVDADTLAAAADVVSQMDEAATAEWFPSYEYVADNVVTSAVIIVATRITMPRWTRHAPTAEKAEWNRFCVALRAHEDGHINLVVRHLSDVDKRMVGKSVAGAMRVWEQALERLKLASRAYDVQTDHGRKQGTVIDVSVDGPE